MFALYGRNVERTPESEHVRCDLCREGRRRDNSQSQGGTPPERDDIDLLLHLPADHAITRLHVVVRMPDSGKVGTANLDLQRSRELPIARPRRTT
jgi:hypothetical protein